MTTTAPATIAANSAPMTLADFADVLPAIAAHAQQEQPRECCGTVVRPPGNIGPFYYAARNVSPEGTDRFVIDPADWARAEDLGEIVAIAHSHPNADANPSEADRVMCEQTGLPWLIMGWPSKVATLTLPCGYEAPLEGRSFHHGILDCYTLIQDYYARELGIALPHFERPDDWWTAAPDRPALDLYTSQFEQAGFVRVDGPPQPHDGLLMQVKSDRLNHAAVYLGDGIILHHLYKRASCKDVYGGYWARHTGMIVRHKDVIARRSLGELGGELA